MALKRESSKKLSSIYYQNISEKIKRKLNEGKFELKPSFVKKKNKNAYDQTVQNIHVLTFKTC